MSIVERALEKARGGKTDGGSTQWVERRRIGGTGPQGPQPPQPPQQPAQPEHELPQAGVELGREGQVVDTSLVTLRNAGLAVPRDMENTIAEELRLIKRPLLLNAESNGALVTNQNLLMVASALPGAGKTFLSMNLAMSMASELDWTVLLVDADVTRSTLSRRLGLADVPGLVTLLEEERRDFGDFVYRTSMPGLHVLPAGPARANVKELLGSQRMRALIADLTAGQRRRIVLFDSPPLLLTSEARVLASYVGQVVLVVEADVTPRRSVLDAIETLDPAKAINLVLNKNQQRLGIGDYHYAGYSLGREHQEPEG